MAELADNHPLQNFANFRVLCSKDGSDDTSCGLLYRSSRPDLLDDEKFSQLTKLGIRSVIDFRSKSEYFRADGPKPLDSVSALYVVKIPHKKSYKPNEKVKYKLISKPSQSEAELVDILPESESESDPNDETQINQTETNNAGDGIGKLKRNDLDSSAPSTAVKETNVNGYNVASAPNPLKNGNRPHLNHFLIDFFTGRFIWTVFKRAPWYLRIYAIFWLIIDYILNTGHRYFVQTFSKYMLNPAGLIGQYKDIIDLSQRSICAGLKLLTDPDNIPALINCAHGKDRTGIVTALIMSCLGKSNEEIIKEYSRSAEGLQPVIARIHREIVVRYHMSEQFLTADAATMRSLLDYITEQYGSVYNYLESIGFSAGEQEQLRRNLLCTEL